MKRKVFLFKIKDFAHIVCVCLFIDGINNTNTILISSVDNGWVVVPDKYENNTQIFGIPLQSDYKSCGVVALKMAKHLTIDWYNTYKKKLGDKNINDIIPTKLLSYKQKDLYKLEEEYKSLFNGLLKKGYIKNIKGIGVVNAHLQETKTKIKYCNAYYHRKKKLNNNDKDYFEEKQNIIKEMEDRFDKQQQDSDFSSDENGKDADWKIVNTLVSQYQNLDKINEQHQDKSKSNI